MKKPTAADLAAKYSTVRKYPCILCGLKPDQLDLLRKCRGEQGMSYRGLTLAARGEWSVRVSERAVYNHFANHETAA